MAAAPPSSVQFAIRPAAPTEAPAPTAAPTPTATPEPTPAPDPYVDGMARTTYADGFYCVELNDALRARITGLSYPAAGTGGRIGYDDLRYVRIRHVDFDGVEHVGELIVNAGVADEIMEIFHALYEARYPLTSVRLVDDFEADDDASMAADNTSAFNYRALSGSTRLSLHSFGVAIDVNPMRNPYIRGSRVDPPNGQPYVDRTQDFAGKIDENDLCFQLFTDHGWAWGGYFKTSKDYQHFSKDLGYVQ